MRVWHDGAWAAPALDAELRRSGSLDRRDARLATELVYGVLRTQRALESTVARHAKNDRWKKQPVVHAQLCIAAYTILFLERVPTFAAVSEAVTAIKLKKGRRVAGFANAVLRKLADSSEGVTLLDAVAKGVPSWLHAALRDVLGQDGARRFITAPFPAPLCLCLRASEQREIWLSQLQQARPDAKIAAGKLSPHAILLHGAGDLRQLPGHDSAWSSQEEGSQILALAVGSKPGDTILDACAGRGGKALLMAEQGATIDTADLHPSKLQRLRANPAGQHVRNTHAVDWTRGTGDVPDGYDRVLVDAPCSGTGTLRRRPEIAVRIAASDVARLAALQLEISRSAATRVKIGGRLIYSVCTVLRDECEGVVQALCDSTDLEPAPFDSAIATGLCAEETTFRLLPHVHGTDGYFVASFVRKA